MSTEKMRDSFKEWAMTTGFEEHHFSLRDDGEFKDYDVRRLWEPWQASRAAIELELPEAFCAYGGQGHHGSDPDDAYIAEDVVSAIESIGLKVKP